MYHFDSDVIPCHQTCFLDSLENKEPVLQNEGGRSFCSVVAEAGGTIFKQSCSAAPDKLDPKDLRIPRLQEDRAAVRGSRDDALGPQRPQQARPIQFVTVNATAAGSLRNYLLTSTAHVVMAQELKTSGGSSEQLHDLAICHGWKILAVDPMSVGDTRAHKAGVAIFERMAGPGMATVQRPHAP